MNVPENNRTEVIIAESVLDRVLDFYNKNSYCAKAIINFFTSIRNNEIKGQILKLTDAIRPIWCSEIYSENYIYFTIGVGSKCQEIRICHFGTKLEENDLTLKQLLRQTGESLVTEADNEISLLEKFDVDCFPIHPFRKFSEGDDLTLFLHPVEKYENLSNFQEDNFDDLFWHPFRILKDIRQPSELPIRLSSQQQRTLHCERPLLVQGVSGSGKTTLLTHFAHKELIRNNNDLNILIIAYTESLKGYILSLLNALTISEPIDLSKINIYCWKELCNHFASSLKLKPYQWLNDIDNTEFDIGAHLKLSSKINRHEQSQYTTTELKEIIRAIIKGNAFESNDNFINKDTFLKLPELPIDKFIDRNILYDLACKYQVFLFSKNLVDDQDVAYELFTKRNELPKYDYVLVDEAHDYTLIQLMLFSSLAKRSDGLVFIGDIDQVIYPSYFSWEKARSAIYHVWHENAPHEVSLDYNYRNPQPVFEISKSLLKMRLEKLGIEHKNNAISNQAMNPEPLRIIAQESEINSILEELAINIGSLGIIGQKIVKTEIAGIELQRVFTPENVKGIEFDIVCLLNYNHLYRDLVIKGKTRFTPRQLFLKFNEVYVSVTRTRRQLIVIDSSNDNDGLWDIPELNGYFYTNNDSRELLKIVIARYKIKDQNSWKNAALDFENQKAFASAAECWERAGHPDKAASAYELAERFDKAIKLFKATNNFSKAADLCLRIGDFRDAAEIYTTLNEYLKAAKLWLNDGNYFKAATLFQKDAELNGKIESWELAAKYYLSSKKISEAAECYKRLKKWQMTAECYEKLNKWEFAADYWTQFGDSLKAALCWENANMLEKAAFVYEEIGQFEKAAILFKTVGNLNHAGEIFRKIKKYSEAAECFSQIKEFNLAAELWILDKNNFKAAIMYKRHAELTGSKDSWALAAKEFQFSHKFEKALECFEVIEDWAKVADCHERLNNWEDAAIYWELAGESEKAKECLETEAKNREASGDIEKAAELWKKIGNLKRADELLEAINYKKKSSKLLNELKPKIKSETETQKILLEKEDNKILKHSIHSDVEKYIQANQLFNNILKVSNLYTIDYLEEMANACEGLYLWDIAAEFWEKSKKYKKAAIIYEYREKWESAARMWIILYKWQNAAMCYEKSEKWQEAADIWIKEHDYERAISCCTICKDYYTHTKILLSLNKPIEAVELYNKIFGTENTNKELFKDQKQKIEEEIIPIRKYIENAEEFYKNGSFEEAANIWMKLNCFDKALTCFTKSKNWSQAAQCNFKLDNWQEAINLWLKVKDFNNAAICYEKMERFYEAGSLYLSLKNYDKAAAVYERIPDLEKAKLSWAKANDITNMKKCEEQIRQSIIDARMWYNCNMYAEAAKKWEFAGKISKAIMCYKLAKKDDQANKLIALKKKMRDEKISLFRNTLTRLFKSLFTKFD
jgi:superfamily I DNA/RNA helicase/tetratricopeptide (TPR) repeat protein